MKPHTTKKNTKFIAFDTEDNGKGASANFICACFYSPEKEYVAKNRQDTLKFITSSNTRLPSYWVAHNLQYDLNNIDFPENSVDLFFLNSRLINGKYRNRSVSRTFIDTGNFFVGATIDQLGKKLGIPKIDYDVMQLRNKHPSNLSEKEYDEVIKYCMNDAKICYYTIQSIVNLCNQNKTKFKSSTAASLALKIYRTNFHREDWKKPPKEQVDFERQAYYGGRTEVFNYGKHPVVDYEDIVSSYPFQMTTLPLPHIAHAIRTKRPPQDIHHLAEGSSKVIVKAPKMNIPILPHRHEGKLLFPYGTWEAHYTHNEMRYAEKYGYKFEILESIYYNQTFMPFKEYTEYFFNLKNNSKGIERDFYKLMLNSLSGKFGERNNQTVRCRIENAERCTCDVEASEAICPVCKKLNFVHCYTDPGCGWISVSNKTDYSYPKHAFPILISYITAGARIKLHKRLLKCHTPVYCDTDSCISLGPPNEELGEELGQWERKQMYEFKAHAPKFYFYKGGSKIKGVPKRAKFDGKKYIFEAPLKLGAAIHRKMLPNTWITVEKFLDGKDTKRKRMGCRSEPLRVNNVN